ncbi:MAG: hypothetical protein ACJAV5_001491 [Vicingaceae bacterium]|jgi:hypothetical protein
MKKISILIAGFLLAFAPVKADEGMWLPMFVKRLNYVDMQKQGLQLTPEEIYSVNNSSLKDAIVRLGRGFCTGEIISDQGLMLTNHHCGFGVIQENSTEEHNYLDDGFWAMNREDELPAGFAVSFLVRMEDVSKSVNELLNEDMSLADRAKAIKKVSDSLEKAAVGESEYTANVKSFYDGNEFYLFVYETFPDVRLVGAPPSSVGKFGGDTDNWMWPRHTGDFTMFRVYADKDNKPAEYSKDNKPYTPKHSLPISLKGVEPGDFSMIFGYPGSTDRYLTSEGINYELEVRQPASVKLRREVLDMYQAGMDMNEKTRIQYASKFASVANYWKYFIGQQAGLKRLKVYDKKKAQEDALAAWIAEDEDRKKLYANVIEGFKTGYDSMKEANRVRVYLNEAIFRVEAIAYSFQFSGLQSALESENETSTKQTVERIQEGVEGHFKDYNMEIDRNVFAAMMKAYSEDIPKENQPEDFKKMVSKYKGDFQKMANVAYDKSIFGSKEKVEAFLENPSVKALAKDPILMIQSSIIGHYRSAINPIIAAGNEGLQRSKRLFIKGLREMNSDKVYAADANSTMRFTYGQVGGYEPKDGATYSHITTAQGILEKEDPSNPEFVVPAKLKKLIQDKDYGQYADKSGALVVNFIANNDITGGNSGSPMINGNGELIGTAFDGNWEAMSGDIAFEPELQRTIGVDIRYTLFIIDKYAGAGHLIDEMKLVK